MMLELKRDVLGDDRTLGKLSIDGNVQFYTVEDTVREQPGQDVAQWKEDGITAIPAGSYNVIITMSNRFKRLMPLLENVPGFSGVRIHSGNTEIDTEGCIIVGYGRSSTGVTESRPACSHLQADIQRALDKGDKVTIKIG